jgi:hypothetical protein
MVNDAVQSIAIIDNFPGNIVGPLAAPMRTIALHGARALPEVDAVGRSLLIESKLVIGRARIFECGASYSQ